MKYKLLLALAVLCIGAIILDSSQKAYSNAAGAPAGCSGSPADGNTCAASGCHTGSNVSKINGWITSNIPAGGYTPGTTYLITAKAIYIGRGKFGFEVSPQDLSGNIIGTLQSINAAAKLRGPGYISHTTSGNTGTDSLIWTFNWKAPAAGTGGFTFYGAFNCANNDGNTGGDLIYTSTLKVTEAPSPGVDAGILHITSPSLYSCSGTVIPTVQIHNFGITPLTSATINYQADANTPSSFSWTGNLATDSSALVTLPAVTVSSGTHTFTAFTSTPNAVADTIPADDSKTVSFDVKLTPQQTPFAEGFDTTLFPKSGWEINNPNNDTTWRRTTKAFHSGVASVFINNFNYPKLGAIDEIITPSFNLSVMPTPVLTFQVAYQLYTNPSSSSPASDTLVVYISTDCGTTWNQLYKKYGVPLTTATPTYSTKSFVPTASQWRFESINLSGYTSAAQALFKFVNITDYENNLYLDDIHIDNSLGIAGTEVPSSSLLLYPNPASDRLLADYELAAPVPVSIKLYDMLGKEMSMGYSDALKPSGKYTTEFDLKNLPAGIYVFHFQAGQLSETRRFTISR